MLIEEKKLSHWIDNFYGYGSWNARFWFVAYEEGGGETPEEVSDKINYFYEAHGPGSGATLCDIRELYRRVAINGDGPQASRFNNLHEYRFGDNAVLHGVWKNLIAFVNGYLGNAPPDPLTFQQHDFASPSAQEEALIRLYPLPAPHSHAWYYNWLDLPNMRFLGRRASYEEHTYRNRVRTILAKISACKPEFVLMYGMNNILALKRSVQEAFDGVRFKMVKAAKQQTPQYHRTEINGTTLVITTQIPALRHRRIETGFNWERFGNSFAHDR